MNCCTLDSNLHTIYIGGIQSFQQRPRRTFSSAFPVKSSNHISVNFNIPFINVSVLRFYLVKFRYLSIYTNSCARV